MKMYSQARHGLLQNFGLPIFLHYVWLGPYAITEVYIS